MPFTKHVEFVQVLRILITILDNSRDTKTLAVACHDIAQFIQVHPAGRGIILDLKAKERVMKHMSHPNPEVSKQALLCVQKILLSAKYASYMQ
jgi:V-type H+-transporting ATPase subunit H